MLLPLTSFEEIHWPAIPNQLSSNKLALQYQLDESQWWTHDKLLKYQLEQLNLVFQHALKTVPFYTELYKSALKNNGNITSLNEFSNLSIVTREQIQAAGLNFVSKNIPKQHGKIYEKSTSGSTGASLKIKDTDIGNFFFHGFTLRDHLWHERDTSKKLAVIRLTHTDEFLPPHGKRYEAWGASSHGVYKSGSSTVLSINATIDEQWIWLKKQNPEYLLTYPSALKGLLEKSKKEGRILTNLREVSTLAEIVTDEMRDTVRKIWNVPLKDMYSSQEVGYMALQCPDYEHYHVQSESVILEVLNDNNQSCKPGEIGRVVITTLHNFASPLIRYEIGDYAEVGETCPCGRGLPVLNKIMGRERNLVSLPDGSKRWVWVGVDLYGDLINIKKFQMIQHSLEKIEVKLVCKPHLTIEQEQALTTKLHETMGYAFQITFNYVDNIQRSKGGKFEDFISNVK